MPAGFLLPELVDQSRLVTYSVVLLAGMVCGKADDYT